MVNHAWLAFTDNMSDARDIEPDGLNFIPRYWYCYFLDPLPLAGARKVVGAFSINWGLENGQTSKPVLDTKRSKRPLEMLELLHQKGRDKHPNITG